MAGYESLSGNPFQTSRGNGSAYEMLNLNPALFGMSPGHFGAPNPWFGTHAGLTQQHPYPYQTPYAQTYPNPGSQPQLNPFYQQQNTPQFQHTQGSQAGPTGNPWMQSQQLGFFGGTNLQGPNLAQNPAVYTTRAVDVDLTIPAQTVLGRNPIEIQHYVLQVVVPTLVDALVKRCIASDAGQSISVDLRGGCIARVGI
ncbi:MAG: hypothetical protein JO041_00140 [Acidobacteria bacterium]|nr:hypothetical protein [Acidobacteriota bacterium]